MERIQNALERRIPFLDPPHHTALRLFNGFSEGLPGLVLDLYASTLVVHNLAAQPDQLAETVGATLDLCRARLPWLSAGLLKMRHALDPEERKGRLLFGSALPRKVCENGVWYALDLRLNQDAGFYLDTRGLRAWLKQASPGLAVLNTFAYTGSLGAACAAGGAQRVLQVDLNQRFLNLAKDTYALNGLPVRRSDFLAEDFFRTAARLRRSGERFDLALLDPPFFSTTSAGRVDLFQQGERLINKVRPLLNDGGRLVVVNNALYLSGRDFLAGLERLGEGGYLNLEEILPVPDDICGFPGTQSGAPPADPAPFNHSTKIAILRIRHKVTTP